LPLPLIPSPADRFAAGEGRQCDSYFQADATVSIDDLRQLRDRVVAKYPGSLIHPPSVECAPSRPDTPRSVSLAIEVDLGCGCCGDWEASGIEDDDLDLLVAFPSIRELNLKLASVTDNGIARLAAGLPHLQTLNLEETAVTSSGLHPLSRLKDLRALQLSANLLDDEAMRVFGQLPKLENVSLYGTQVTDQGFGYLAGCEGLQNLSAHGSGITDAGVARFASTAKPRLTTLSLAQTGITDAALDHLAGIPSLEYLDLSGTGVTDAGLIHLAELKGLTSLSLRGLPITSNGLRSLAGLTRLRYLYLNETQVADDGLRHLQRMPELNQLWLAKTPVRGYGFADLRGLSQLQYTSLPTLDAAAVPALTAIPSWQRLELSVRSGGQASGKSEEASVLRIVDQPKLQQLQLTLDAGIDDIRIENCPRVWSVQLTVSGPLKRVQIHRCEGLNTVGVKAALPTSIDELELIDLPNCQALTLENISLGGVSPEDVVERLERVQLKGSSDNGSLRQLLQRN
jgi:Leucine-rich repeat (LRR) protein